MNKFIVAIVLSISILSCNNRHEDKGKFTLNGEIKNIADQKIYLEQIYFSQKDPEVLDTAEVKNGKFELSAIAQEEGLYRLRLEKLEHGFIFINDQNKINFKADIKDVSLEGPAFNTRANEMMKKFMVDLNNRSIAISKISTAVDSLKTVAGNDSLQALETTKLQTLDKDFKTYIIKYIDTVSDPVISMFALGYTRNIDPITLKDIIPNLTKRFPNHQGIASIVLQYNQFVAQQNEPKPAAQATPQIGSAAPDFTINDVEGKPVSLASYKGKYVLVDFWASWCGPCRGENPNVVAAYNKFKDKNFTILGVSLDEDKNAWIKAIKEDNLSWKHVSDLKGFQSAAAILYGFDGIPYNVLVDPQGKVVATALRGESLEKKLGEVLQ